jgi:hypothetical protein
MEFILTNIPLGKIGDSHGMVGLLPIVRGKISCYSDQGSKFFDLVAELKSQDPPQSGSRRAKLYPSDLRALVPMYYSVTDIVESLGRRSRLTNELPSSLRSYLCSLLTVISLLESRWDTRAINTKSGARGAFQILPSTLSVTTGERKEFPADYASQCLVAIHLIERVLSKLIRLYNKCEAWRKAIYTTYNLQREVDKRLYDVLWPGLASNPALSFIPSFWSGGYTLTLGSLSYSSLVYLLQRLVVM